MIFNSLPPPFPLSSHSLLRKHKHSRVLDHHRINICRYLTKIYVRCIFLNGVVEHNEKHRVGGRARVHDVLRPRETSYRRGDDSKEGERISSGSSRLLSSCSARAGVQRAQNWFLSDTGEHANLFLSLPLSDRIPRSFFLSLSLSSRSQERRDSG